jgi:hypothetical protein
MNEKQLCFAPHNHIYGGDWDMEWTTGRRFVRPTEFLRVWEGGAIEIRHSTDGYPQYRDQAARLGIYIYMRDDLPEVRTVEGGKIAKAWLDKEMYVVDYKSRRVFAISGRPFGNTGRYGSTYPPLGYRLRWPHINSIPYSAFPVSGYIPDRQKAKQWLEMNKDMLLQAKGIAALEGRMSPSGFDTLHEILMLRTALAPLQMERVGASMGYTVFNKVVARITAQRLEVPHLMLA